MRELKWPGLLVLLLVASALGMNSVSAAPKPQVESQDENKAIITAKEYSQPWEAPVDLSLFFAATFESDVSEYQENGATRQPWCKLQTL